MEIHVLNQLLIEYKLIMLISVTFIQILFSLFLLGPFCKIFQPVIVWCMPKQAMINGKLMHKKLMGVIQPRLKYTTKQKKEK